MPGIYTVALEMDTTCKKCGAPLKAGERARKLAGQGGVYGLRCHRKTSAPGGTKVMIFWVRKKTRKPLMVGQATAKGSAVSLWEYRSMAMRGLGRVFVVEGRTADEGRYLIDGYLKKQERFGVTQVAKLGDKEVIVAMGLNAVMAVAGSNKVVGKYFNEYGEVIPVPMGDDVYARALDPEMKVTELDIKSVFGGPEK